MRSIWKFPFFTFSTLKTVDYPTDKRIQVYSKSGLVLPSLVGKRVSVYNGKIFFSILIRNYMVGHAFGNFIYTKKGGSKIHLKSGKEAKRKLHY